METLVYILVLSLSFALLGNIKSSPYGTNVFSVSERWKQNRSIANILNWMQRQWDSIQELIEKKIRDEIENGLKSLSKDERQKRRLIAVAYKKIQTAIFSPESFVVRIELWNPKDSSKRRLLGEREQEREKKGQTHEKGFGATGAGNSPFRLSQIVAGISKYFVKKHGTIFNCVEIDPKKVKKEGIEKQNFARVTKEGETYMVTVGDLFDLAEKYHERTAEERAKRQAEKDSSDKETETEEVAGQATVEAYLDGKFKPSETEDIALLEQLRDDDDVTGAKQAALTKRINKLQS